MRLALKAIVLLTLLGALPSLHADPSLPLSATPSSPRLHVPSIYGVRPGAPFLLRIPATGKRPMTFSAQGLPSGLVLDPVTGLITGRLSEKGNHAVTLTAKNGEGSVEERIEIRCGDLIGLTPPMGWNSWNCFGAKITAADIRAAADALISSGLADHGWNYINIDDGWAGERDAAGKIQTNAQFPDMKALCDYVHSKGLKIGIYSSPGAKTCAGFNGSLGHELADAQSYGAWGFDYLKYDWCGYSQVYKESEGVAGRIKPYRIMRDALDQVSRDIFYSLCQYGDGEVWKWGTQVGANSWRTTGDIHDLWTDGKLSYQNGLGKIGFLLQNGLENYAGPGHWNDPDMLVVGQVGWGDPHPTRLTPDEQYTHVSLWSLLSAPLLIGCDLTKLDPFTLGLLTNDEVLAVNQDPLGQQGRRVVKKGDREVWIKELADGSKVIAFFNLGKQTVRMGAAWNELGLAGKQSLRDLWRQADLGTFDDGFKATIAPHGVVLLRTRSPLDPKS